MAETRPAAFDYNDPVFRHGTEARAFDYSTLKPEFANVHPYVADRIAARRPALVLDLGCGPCVLGRLLDERGTPWVGLDIAANRLRLGHGDRVLGDALALPFPDSTFDAVATLYTLYHFEDPSEPVREAFRVLQPGGWFVTCAPSRFDSPELAGLLGPQPYDTFDSDMGPGLVQSVFSNVEVKPWEMPLYRFPHAEGMWDHLVASGYGAELATRIVGSVEYPFWLTKRGATIWARKPLNV